MSDKERDDVQEINFYLRDDEYGWMSNFWRAKQLMSIDGRIVEFPTNEHYYQSMKAEYLEVREWIANAPTPFLAMKAGRSLRKKKELVDDWESKKVEIMKRGLDIKFQQHPDLREKLLATGDRPLHEDSPSDMFWGKKGKDMLGKLLMEIRNEYREAMNIAMETLKENE